MKWKIAFSILALSFATQVSADERSGGDAAILAMTALALNSVSSPFQI